MMQRNRINSLLETELLDRLDLNFQTPDDEQSKWILNWPWIVCKWCCINTTVFFLIDWKLKGLKHRTMAIIPTLYTLVPLWFGIGKMWEERCPIIDAIESPFHHPGRLSRASNCSSLLFIRMISQNHIWHVYDGRPLPRVKLGCDGSGNWQTQALIEFHAGKPLAQVGV